jgi:HlyD family secretion protein
MIKRKHIWWLVIAVVAAGVVWLSLRPKVIDVETATVARAPMKVTVDEEGETRLRHRFVVSAPVPGRVLRIESRPGDIVKAGQTIAVIQPAAPAPLDARTQTMGEARVSGADAAATRAKAERERLGVELKQAEADAARAKALFDTGVRPKGSVGTGRRAGSRAAGSFRRRGLRCPRGRVRSPGGEGRVGFAVARRPAGRAVTVSAPIAGVILKRMQESEAVVVPGAPLVEIRQSRRPGDRDRPAVD